MTSLGMDWNSKTPVRWDWENLVLLGGKESELRKPARQHEWMVEGAAGGIGNGTLYSSGSGACSGSELCNGSSKSSISFSMDSSSKAAAMEVPEFNFEAAEGFPRNLCKSKELVRVEDTGTSPVAVAKFGRGDPPIGLKLGKRTYFEDVCAGHIIKNPSPSLMPSTTLVKRTRVRHQSMQTAYCQVQGCNVDLATAKDYHRKHRVCENHSKSPKVIIAGQECRFCQQCSRFHGLSEFDQKKRSCRKRLSDHNARRRKPQPETISFNSSWLSSSFYETSHLPGKQALPIAKRWFASPDDRQQVNLLLSRVPFDHMQTMPSSTWEGSGGFKLTQTKESWIKSTKARGIGRMLHLPGSELSNNVCTLHHGLGRLLPFKGNTAEVLSQGLGASLVASNLDGARDLGRALSLLSTDSWGLAKPGTTSDNQLASTDNTTAAYPAMHAIDVSSGFWQDEQTLAQHTRVLPVDLHSHTSQFQEFQPLKTPYEAALFGSRQTH